MKINKILATGLCVAAISSTMLAMNRTTFADETTTTSDAVIDEAWGKPTFVKGAALSETQISDTMTKLGVTVDAVNTETAYGSDLVKYLGYGSGDDSVMYSSVVVTREASGKGLTVEIETPDNITSITADQYKNPLITAGISDADVKVASVVKVTGESALTGVYKAFEANGTTVDTDRAELAQEELSTTTAVADDIVENANKDTDETLSSSDQDKADEAYKTQLNQALIDIKQELADIKNKQNETASKSDIEQIVNDALAKNNLSDYVTKDNVSQLVTLAQGYQTTDGVLDADSMAQLKDLSKDFKSTVDDLAGQLGSFGDKLKENQGFFAGLWQSIKDFFTNLVK